MAEFIRLEGKQVVLQSQNRVNRRALESLTEADQKIAREFAAGLAKATTPQAMKSIAAIEQLGGRVTFDGKLTVRVKVLPKKGFPETELRHLANLTHLKKLKISGPTVTDTGIEHLKGLNELESLTLMGTNLTNVGMSHLVGLTDLLHLNIAETKVTDAGLAHLAGLKKLISLNLMRNKVSDAGMVHLSELANFQFLTLAFTKVTDTGLAHLESLRKLRRLVAIGTEVTGPGVKNFNLAVPNCKVLWSDPNKPKRLGRPIPRAP